MNEKLREALEWTEHINTDVLKLFEFIKDEGIIDEGDLYEAIETPLMNLERILRDELEDAENSSA